MKTANVLAATVLGVASISLLAQQPAPSEPQTSNPPPPAAEQSQAPPAAASTTSAAMSTVNGELVDKLDSKTAKTGDSVVIKTKSNVKHRRRHRYSQRFEVDRPHHWRQAERR